MLNDYDKTMKPAIDAVHLAKEGKDVGSCAPGIAKGLSTLEQQNVVAASRDPRLARGNA